MKLDSIILNVLKWVLQSIYDIVTWRWLDLLAFGSAHPHLSSSSVFAEQWNKYFYSIMGFVSPLKASGQVQEVTDCRPRLLASFQHISSLVINIIFRCFSIFFVINNAYLSPFFTLITFFSYSVTPSSVFNQWWKYARLIFNLSEAKLSNPF